MKKTSSSLIRQNTYIEALIRLIKDDLIRDHMLPDLEAVNLSISQLKSFRNLAKDQCKVYETNTI